MSLKFIGPDAVTMSRQNFTALIKARASHPLPGTINAARRVLVDGESATKAAASCGVQTSTVTRFIRRITMPPGSRPVCPTCLRPLPRAK